MDFESSHQSEGRDTPSGIASAVCSYDHSSQWSLILVRAVRSICESVAVKADAPTMRSMIAGVAGLPAVRRTARPR